MSNEQVCYLSGPPKLTAFVFQVIRDGEALGINVSLEAFEHAYRTLPFPEFVELYLQPVMEQLFPPIDDKTAT